MDLTNLVLAVVLSACGDTARKLELPLPSPLTTNHVSEVFIHQTYPHLHVSVLLTNGAAFSYNRGQVMGYTSKEASRFGLFEPGAVRTTNGPPLGKAWAIDFCRAKMSALGYDPERLYMDTEPSVRTQMPPGYVFVEWEDPRSKDLQTVRMEIDTCRRLITEMRIPGALAHPRPEPNIPGLAAARKAAETSYLEQTPAARKETVEVGDPRVLEALTEISVFAERLSLPCGRLVETNQVTSPCQVDNSRFYPDLCLRLRNGCRFSYDLHRKRVTAYDDGRPFFDIHFVRWRDYVGQWRVSEAGATRLVADAAAKVGWNVQELMRTPPRVKKPNVHGTNVIARYWLTWERGIGGHLDQGLYAEVDADAGRVTAIGFTDYTD